MKSDTIPNFCHGAIETQYVFSEENQVYLRTENETPISAVANEVWSPINFQWKPDIELKNSLKHQSKDFRRSLS